MTVNQVSNDSPGSIPGRPTTVGPSALCGNRTRRRIEIDDLGKAIQIKNQNIPDGKKRLAGQLEVGSIGRHNMASVYGVGNMIFNYIRRMNPSGLGTRLENGGLG